MVLRGDVLVSVSAGGRFVSYREALGIEPRRSHVDLRTQPQMCGATLAVEVEDHTLTLAKHAEHRAVQRVGGEIDLGEIGVAYDDPVPGGGVVRLDHALHRRHSSLTGCGLRSIRTPPLIRLETPSGRGPYRVEPRYRTAPTRGQRRSTRA